MSQSQEDMRPQRPGSREARLTPLVVLFLCAVAAPALVLFLLLASSVVERHELELEKRRLQRRDASQAVQTAVSRSLEDAVLRARMPERFRSDWAAIRIEADGRILPFEKEGAATQRIDDALILGSPRYFDGVREEQRGDLVAALVHYRRALASGDSAGMEHTRISLSIARVLQRLKRYGEALALLDGLRTTNPVDAWERARSRVQCLEALDDAAEATKAREIARSMLPDLRERMGLIEFLRLEADLKADLDAGFDPQRQSTELMQLYRFLDAQRGRLLAADARPLLWEDATRPAMLVMRAPVDGRIVIQDRSELIEAALHSESAVLRPFTRAVGEDVSFRVELKELGTTLQFRDREPLPASAWSSRDAQLTLWLALLTAVGLGSGLLFTLRAVSRQSKLSRMRADFISSVSHELKTPLTSLRLYSDLLTSQKITDEAKRRGYELRIQEETKKLTQLVANVLDAARIEAGRDYHMKELDLSELARSSADSFTARAEAKGASIDLSSCEEPCCLDADAEALEHVISNLLDNAIKYGGPHLRVATCVNGAWVELRVMDDGSGIPAKQRARMFQAYERGAEHGPGCPAGSGLGLAIVADVVAAHGGRVEVEERSDPGTCMLVTLPTMRPTNPCTEEGRAS